MSLLADWRDRRRVARLPVDDVRLLSDEEYELVKAVGRRAEEKHRAKSSARQARRAKPERVRFVAVERAFKPEVQVRALRGLSGWVQRSRPERGQWSLGAGRTGFVDEDTARLWAAKGHAEIVDRETPANQAAHTSRARGETV